MNDPVNVPGKLQRTHSWINWTNALHLMDHHTTTFTLLCQAGADRLACPQPSGSPSRNASTTRWMSASPGLRP